MFYGTHFTLTWVFLDELCDIVDARIKADPDPVLWRGVFGYVVQAVSWQVRPHDAVQL